MAINMSIKKKEKEKKPGVIFSATADTNCLHKSDHNCFILGLVLLVLAAGNLT